MNRTKKKMVDFWRNYDNLRKMSKVSLKCRIRGYYVVRVLSLDGTELIFCFVVCHSEGRSMCVDVIRVD